MKSISLSTGEWLLVVVPKDAICEIVNFENLKVWVRWYTPSFSDNGNIDLPPGQWSIVGKPLELSEEICKTIVRVTIIQGSTFGTDYQNKKAFKRSAKESLLSLVESEGFEPETTLILKKII